MVGENATLWNADKHGKAEILFAGQMTSLSHYFLKNPKKLILCYK